MLVTENLLSRPSIEINVIREAMMKKERIRFKFDIVSQDTHQFRTLATVIRLRPQNYTTVD